MNRYTQPYGVHRTMQTGRLGHLGCIHKMHLTPAETISGKVSIKARFNQFNKPLMNDFIGDIWSIYVPYRMLWDGWTDFIAEISNTPPPTTTTRYRFLGAHDNEGTITEWSKWEIEAYKLIYNLYFARIDVINDLDPIDDAYFSTDNLKNFGAVVPPRSNGLMSKLQANVTTTPAAHNDEAIDGTIHTSPDGDPSHVLLEDDGAGAAHNLDLDDLEQQIPIYKEMKRRAHYGSEYEDIMARLGTKLKRDTPERPEVWGRKRVRINVSDSLQGGDTTQTGYMVATCEMTLPKRYAPEHGILLTLMTYRPDIHFFDNIDSPLSTYDYQNQIPQFPNNYWMPHFETSKKVPLYDTTIINDPSERLYGYINHLDWYRYATNQKFGEFTETNSSLMPRRLAFAETNQDIIDAMNYDNLFTGNITQSTDPILVGTSNDAAGASSGIVINTNNTASTRRLVGGDAHYMQRNDWNIKRQSPVTPVNIIENRSL